MAHLHKSSPCKGPCFRSKAECAYAHSVKEWNPSHPKMMCHFGMNCHHKNTACFRIHDGSLYDKIRCAEWHGLEFIEPHYPIREERLPVVSVPQVPFVWDNFVASAQQEPVPEPEPVPVQEEPNPEEDPIFQLQQEKRMITLEMESLRIAKEQLKVRILLFKMKASDFWMPGSAEMEIDMRI